MRLKPARAHDCGVRDGLTDVEHRLLEQLAILGQFDGAQRRTEQAHVEALERAQFRELDREVQPRLASERREQRVRTLALDDRLDVRRHERLQIDGVGHLRIRHDRRRI